MSFDGRGFVRSGYSSSCPNRSKLFNLFLNHRGQLYTPEHDIALKVADLVLFFKLFIDVINHLSACTTITCVIPTESASHHVQLTSVRGG